jgi:hypothetical protein
MYRCLPTGISVTGCVEAPSFSGQRSSLPLVVKPLCMIVFLALVRSNPRPLVMLLERGIEGKAFRHDGRGTPVSACEHGFEVEVVVMLSLLLSWYAGRRKTAEERTGVMMGKRLHSAESGASDARDL